jgi:integrase
MMRGAEGEDVVSGPALLDPHPCEGRMGPMSNVRESKLPENVRKRGKNYYYRCRINGKQKDIPLGSDLSVARRLAKQHAGRMAGIKSGLEHPDTATWQEAERRPISEHVEEWHKSLCNRGVCKQYALQSRDRVLRVLGLVSIQRISSLSAHGIEGALADLRRGGIKGRSGNEGLSDRSIHHHAVAIKGFSRWLRKTRRSQEDKLIDLTVPQVVVARKRQALSPEEVAVVIETTRAEPQRACIAGPDRSILYAVATGTGFRLGELESLTPESFDLGASLPMITCHAAYTKNGKEAVQPIHHVLAELIKPWLAAKTPGEPVFILQRLEMARAVRADLKAAGVENATDYDFHSLRHTYITAVVKSGCSVKVAQELARHADPKLTLGVYTHLTVHDLAEGLGNLAHNLPTVGVSAGLTGTDGGSSISSPGQTQADPCRHAHENRTLM